MASSVAASPPASPSAHPVDRLYRALASNGVLVVVAALVGAALAASLLLPQLPADRREPESAVRWLTETAESNGPLGNLLAGAGLFDLWHSLWFQALVGLLALVLLLRLGLAVGAARQRLRPPELASLAAEASRWPLHAAVNLEQEATGADLHDDLVSEGWRVFSGPVDEVVHLAAERSAGGVVAPILGYGGLLIALASLWLSQWVGWQESGITLAPGGTAALGRQPATILSAAVGADSELSGVVLARAGSADEAVNFTASGWARAGNLAIRRRAQGPALEVDISGPDGDALQLQRVEAQSQAASALTLVFEQPRAEQLFLVPARQLVFSVVSFPALPERGFAGPTFLVQAFRVGQQAPLLNEFVEGDASLSVGEDVLQLRAGQFVTLDVSYAPLRPLLWLGVGLALLGLALAIWRPAGQLHLAVLRQGGRAVVHVSLSPSWAWRSAGRWLAAWTATYDKETRGQP